MESDQDICSVYVGRFNQLNMGAETLYEASLIGKNEIVLWFFFVSSPPVHCKAFCKGAELSRASLAVSQLYEKLEQMAPENYCPVSYEIRLD